MILLKRLFNPDMFFCSLVYENINAYSKVALISVLSGSFLQREPLRIFYESLSQQIPSSEMAEFW